MTMQIRFRGSSAEIREFRLLISRLASSGNISIVKCVGDYESRYKGQFYRYYTINEIEAGPDAERQLNILDYKPEPQPEPDSAVLGGLKNDIQRDFCPYCNGDGYDNVEEYIICPHCCGTGILGKYYCDGDGSLE